MNSGIVLLILAEIGFASSTVFAKLVTQTSEISSFEITFARFIFGVIAGFIYLKKERQSFKPHKLSLLIWRGILNSAAVILLYSAAQYTTITNANMLNMTYPAFTFLVAPFINKDKSSPVLLIFLVLSMTGIWLVVNPHFNKINYGDFLGLASGIISAFAVCTLKEARKHDGTFTIVFYMMGTGAIITGIFAIPGFIIPHGISTVYLLLSAFLGVIAQIFITSGYKHVTAKSGSLVSSSRIIFAALLGVSVFSDPVSFMIVSGGILILISIIGVTLLQNRQGKSGIIIPED
jgi:drug/metabolite transporter (DMT)-like permease